MLISLRISGSGLDNNCVSLSVGRGTVGVGPRRGGSITRVPGPVGAV